MAIFEPFLSFGGNYGSTMAPSVHKINDGKEKSVWTQGSSRILVSVKPTRRGAHSRLEHVEKSPVRSPHKYARPGQAMWASRVYPWHGYTRYIIRYSIPVQEHECKRRRICTHLHRDTPREHTRARAIAWVNAVNGLSRARFFPCPLFDGFWFWAGHWCRNREKWKANRVGIGKCAKSKNVRYKVSPRRVASRRVGTSMTAISDLSLMYKCCSVVRSEYSTVLYIFNSRS